MTGIGARPASLGTALERGAPLGRVVRGALWLGGGQMFADLCSIVHLVLLCRALGASTFSTLVLVVMVGQAVAHLFGFQSWRTIVRFGHAARTMPGGMFALCRWVLARDLLVALTGTGLAALLVWQAGDVLRLPAPLRAMAALFCASVLLMQRGIPTGLLRLRQRFALCAAADGFLPVCRMVFALLIYAFGGGMKAAVIGLAAAEFATTLLFWVLALYGDRDEDADLSGEGRPSGAELSHFYWRSGLIEALRLAMSDVPGLGIAMSGGGAALGTFRLASAVAKAASKPVLSFSIAFYSEASRQRAIGGDSNDPIFLTFALVAAALLACGATGIGFALAPLAVPEIGPTLTLALWGAMTIASLATFLEARSLIDRVPFATVVARVAGIASSFLIAWSLGRFGEDAGIAAVAGGGCLHFAILAIYRLPDPERDAAARPQRPRLLPLG